ncbi:lipid-A-disaccharide synthase [Haematobacter genomosp. 1]|uniref:Lipid-A-disaccharide synthase n=1 Tax=Haematobacter genomosp. 1 TaxID=366618 RepID=A0A212AD01_9RHOB|nr:lipid-A-disaccharide synthase [Haematobacter genomosp. 1]OWJ78865.1 lipid-A-disaccharide synthase [Haematobacter genomosp. 1]
MKAYLVAGEPSGDRLGAALMAGLKALVPEIEFVGVGGPGMEAEGLASLFPMEELSVMGLMEVLPKYRHLLRRKDQVVADVLRHRPDVLITIDAPDFCLRVAAGVKEVRPELLTVHYVAPSVWAWRPGRARRMARMIDHVLAILPFEPPYMEAAGMSCDFVGHPVVAEPQATPEEALRFRLAHGIAPEEPLLLVLPGSRRGEVERLAPVFGATIAALPDRPRVVLPTVRGVADLVAEVTARWPVRPLIVPPDAPEMKRAAFGAADAALAASGTVSLELAAADVPMVIAYRFNALTWMMIRRLVKIDTATLVNLVSDTRAVPEFIGENCRPEKIAPALAELLSGGPLRAVEAEAMATTMERLGRGGEPPGLRAARSVLRVTPALLAGAKLTGA